MIDQPLYTKIHKLMPIPCIDLVIVRNNKLLLIKRNREPAKLQYWLPGGRIFRGESLEATAKRIAKDEVGLSVSRLEFLGIGNLLFKEDPFGHGCGTHTVTFIYKCYAARGTPSLDGNHIDYVWWDGKSGKYHPYVMEYGAKAKL